MLGRAAAQVESAEPAAPELEPLLELKLQEHMVPQIARACMVSFVRFQSDGVEAVLVGEWRAPRGRWLRAATSIRSTGGKP